MKHRIVFFLLALLGIFANGRPGEAQSGDPAGGTAARPQLPEIDRAAAAHTATATFAMG
jgi:hypothetical protein